MWTAFLGHAPGCPAGGGDRASLPGGGAARGHPNHPPPEPRPWGWGVWHPPLASSLGGWGLLAHGTRATQARRPPSPIPAFSLGLIGAEILKIAMHIRARADCAILGGFDRWSLLCFRLVCACRSQAAKAHGRGCACRHRLSRCSWPSRVPGPSTTGSEPYQTPMWATSAGDMHFYPHAGR